LLEEDVTLSNNTKP